MGRSYSTLRLLACFISVTTSIECTLAQSVPNVPKDLRFADVSVYLSGAARASVQQEIRVLYMNRPLVEQTIDALRQLTPLWQPYLQDANLPLDFRYVALPLPTTYADGYWSVSAQQAEQAGLRIDNVVDERMHPVIATEKITNYLRNLNEKYKENHLRTLLRYLKVDSRSGSAVESNGTPEPGNAASVWLDVDSPPLIWKILARKIVAEYEEPTYKPSSQYMVYSYQDSGGQSLANLARQLKLPIERFSPYNDWLKIQLIPAVGNYPVLIWLLPDEFPAIRQADKNSSKTAVSFTDIGFPVLTKLAIHEIGLRSAAVFYTINGHRGIQAQPCDNAITLAFYGNISVAVFLAYNELTEQDVVRTGHIYYLEQKDKRAKIPFHIVQRNQSLREVSNIYGVRLSSLLRFNSVEATQRVGAGRVIWLQRKRPRNTPIQYQQIPVEEPVPMPEPEPVLVAEETKPQPVVADSIARQLLIESVGTEPKSSTVLVEPTPVDSKVVGIKAVETKLVKPLIVPTEAPNVIPAKKPVPTEIPNVNVSKPVERAKIHVVRAGQTYYAISQLYGVTPKQLYSWNNLAERIPLEIGQELIVKPAPKRPATTLKSEPTSTPTSKPAPERLINKFVVEHADVVTYHTVKPGQTVYRVALINKVTIDDIMKWNNLNDYTIEVGQKLMIRKPRE